MSIYEIAIPTSKKFNLLPLAALMLSGLSSLSTAAETQATTLEEVELPTVRVEANAEKPEGLKAVSTRVGKVLQDPHDIPQAVTSITNILLEEQQVGSLKEALRNVSGLSFNAAEGGRSGDNMNLRGFYTFGDIYLDGIRDSAQYNRETFNLEQIDVLRGAGSMLFGRGQAGGVINQVSKMPLPFEQYKLTGAVGTEHYKEISLDLNKPINGNAALRINAMQRDEGSWRSNPATGSEPEIHRDGIALSLGLNLYTDNSFWLNYYQLDTNDNPDYGISFDSKTREPGEQLPSDYFWGNENTFDTSDTTMTTLIHEYKISDKSLLRTQLRLAEYDRSYWAKKPTLTTAPDAEGRVGGNTTRMTNYKTNTLQTDYSTQFKLGDMENKVLVGLEYLQEESFRQSLENFGTKDIPYYVPYKASSSGTPAEFESNSYAFYAQDTIEFMPNWRATLGLRRDQMDADYSSSTSPQLKYGENSYRSALSFQPTENVHYYLAWSNSFSPTADLYQLTVTPQPAERSNVLELGTKWVLLEGDLALRGALYQATKDWERNTDLESTASILTKKRRTNGLEIELAGRITDDWEVFSGLALMDAEILEVAENINPVTGAITYANPEYAGRQARNTPRYTFNLWSTYKLNQNWKLGGGLEGKAEREAFNPSSSAPIPTLNGEYHPNTVPAYVRADFMASYEQAKWTVRFNVKNLFDTLYYDAVYDSGGFAVPGTKRTLSLTTEYKF
jgi:catecholate siderophore receptor